MFHLVRESTSARELLLADVTLERFRTGVRPVVTPQVPCPGTLLHASVPGALVRLLSRVDPHVRFQV